MSLKRFNKLIIIQIMCIAALFALMLHIPEVFAQSGGDPFEKATNVTREWTEKLSTFAIAAGGIASVGALILSMMAYMSWGWFFRIAGSSVAISGLTWIFEQLQ